MAKSKVPATPQGKAYEAISDTRKKLTEQRRKTRDLFEKNQLLRKEAVDYLKGIYTTRGVKGYRSDPSFTSFLHLNLPHAPSRLTSSTTTMRCLPYRAPPQAIPTRDHQNFAEPLVPGMGERANRVKNRWAVMACVNITGHENQPEMERTPRS